MSTNHRSYGGTIYFLNNKHNSSLFAAQNQMASLTASSDRAVGCLLDKPMLAAIVGTPAIPSKWHLSTVHFTSYPTFVQLGQKGSSWTVLPVILS